MPIEVMAARGVDTLRFGPMKPVGLDNPHDTTPNIRKAAGPMLSSSFGRTINSARFGTWSASRPS